VEKDTEFVTCEVLSVTRDEMRVVQFILLERGLVLPFAASMATRKK